MPLDECRLRKRKDKTKFGFEQREKEVSLCVCVCVCVFSSCRSALMQHVFRPKNFTLVASSSLWDPSLSSSRIWFGMNVCVHLLVSVCVCLCAPPLLPGPESSTQLSSECTLRPHIVPRFYESALQSILSVLSGRKATCVKVEVAFTEVTLDHQRHTALRHPCPGRAQNCQATRGKQEAGPEQGVQ